MARRQRAYRSRWLLGPAVFASVVAQGAAYVVYDLSQPTPRPHLSVRLEGEGKGQVLITRAPDGMTLARCVPAVDELGDIRALPLVPGIVATTQRVSDLIAHRDDPPVLHATNRHL